MKKAFSALKKLFLEDVIRFNEDESMKVLKTLHTFELNATVYAVSHYEGVVSLQKYI